MPPLINNTQEAAAIITSGRGGSAAEVKPQGLTAAQQFAQVTAIRNQIDALKRELQVTPRTSSAYIKIQKQIEALEIQLQNLTGQRTSYTYINNPTNPKQILNNLNLPPEIISKVQATLTPRQAQELQTTGQVENTIFGISRNIVLIGAAGLIVLLYLKKKKK